MGLRRDCSTLNCPRVRQAHRLPTCGFCSLLSDLRLFRLWRGQNRPAGRREFAGRVEARRRAPGAGEYERAGWYSEATSSGKNCRPTRASKAARSPRGRTSGRPPGPGGAHAPLSLRRKHGILMDQPLHDLRSRPLRRSSPFPHWGQQPALELDILTDRPSCRWRSGVNSENRRLLGSAAGSEARWPPSCAALGEAHFLGLGIGTNQSTLPVGLISSEEPTYSAFWSILGV